MSSVVYEGTLKGKFYGFKDRKTIFSFTTGAIFQQNEFKFYYTFAFRPDARVLDKDGRMVIEVDGCDETVEVIQIR